MLALDLGVFNRTAHEVSTKEAALWSITWVSLSLAFNGFIWFYAGGGPALDFLTGYLVEKSLAVDNIFVFVLIFTAFAVPPVYQHRVLFWGILGAIVLRGVLILFGAFLVSEFHWILYAFGAFLVFTGIRIFREREEQEIHVDENIFIRLLRRVIAVRSTYDDQHFMIRDRGRWLATPLFVVMVTVIFTDIVFAVDSIPAIFAITQDPFIVLTSNIFAVLGLRAMYFLIADIVHRFRYLRHGLSVILVFIGTKMLLIDIYKIHTVISLSVIVLVLTTAAVMSMRANRRDERASIGQPASEVEAT